MNDKAFEESLGCAIENAAGFLPEGCLLHISIERGGYGVKLEYSEGIATTDDCESIVDEIETLTAVAVQEHNNN